MHSKFIAKTKQDEMYALTLAVTLKFVPMSRLGAQCYGSWISKRRSVLQIPVTDEKIWLGTNYPTIYYWAQTIQLYTIGYKLSNDILLGTNYPIIQLYTIQLCRVGYNYMGI